MSTVIITLTSAGLDAGPFNLYSDIDGYVAPFESLVDKASLLAGYPSNSLPGGTLIVRIKSINAVCSNYVDVTIPRNPKYLDAYVESMAVTCDCKIIVHGGFSNYGTSAVRDDSHGIVVYDKCGNIDEAFMANYEPGLPSMIAWQEEGIFVDHECNIWLGGDLYGQFNKGHLRKYLPTGVLDATFPETNFNHLSSKPYVDLDGNIYTAGLYSNVDNTLGSWPRDRVSKLLPTGAIDPAFDAGVTGNNSNSAIRPAGNGQMWVHGYFTTWGGNTCGHIVLIDAITGARDFSFDPGTGPNEAGSPGIEPMRMAVDGDDIVMTSYWSCTLFDGVSIPKNIFKVNRDGSLNTAFNLNCGTGFEGGTTDPYYGSGRNGCVNDIIKTSDGKFLVSTLAGTFDGLTIRNVVRLNADGTLDDTFLFELNETLWVWRLLEAGDYYYATMVYQADWYSTGYEYPIKISKDGSSVERFWDYPDCTVTESCPTTTTTTTI